MARRGCLTRPHRSIDGKSGDPLPIPAASVHWSNADSAFVAEVPELPGCMAHGDTQDSALRNVNQAMGLWIDTAREFGDPIPEPKGERLMLA